MASSEAVLPEPLATTAAAAAASAAAAANNARRKAAAAARRKRRKALLSSRKAKKVRIEALQNLMHQAAAANNNNSNSLGNKRRLVHADIDGVQEITNILHNGDNVAVPTECTYEILHQYEAAGEYEDTTKTLLKKGCNNNVSSSNKSSLHIYVPPDLSTIMDTHLFWKQIFVKKSYAIKVPGSNSSTSSSRRGSIGSATSLLDNNGNNNCYSPRNPISTFSEPLQILRTIACKIWPGPVLVYVQVQQPIPGLTVTVNKDYNENNNKHYYTSESNVQHYLVLRNPRHPLTVRVCQEFYKINNNKSTTTPVSSPSLIPTSMTSSAGITTTTTTTTPPVSPPFLRLPSTSSIGSTSSSSLAGLTAAINKYSNLLVGKPLSFSTTNGSIFVTAANQIPITEQSNNYNDKNTIAAVLNGEERKEIFAIPTCEYGTPCEIAVVIDTDHRLIRIHGGGGGGGGSTDNNARRSPISVATTGVAQPGISSATSSGSLTTSATAVAMKINNNNNNNNPRPMIDPSTLMQAIRNFKPQTAKDRVVQAVMMKWNVIAIE